MYAPIKPTITISLKERQTYERAMSITFTDIDLY